MYLIGENNETKCFTFFSDNYYAKILPYDDGTMDITVETTDEDGNTAGKTFSDVPLTNGENFTLDLDTEVSGLVTSGGEEIEKEETVPVASVDGLGEISLPIGECAELAARVLPDYATDKTLTWTSSDSSVAEVDENGKVTAKAVGTATVRASSSDGPFCEAEVEVYVPATSLTLDTTELRMAVGDTFTVNATVSDGATHEVSWNSGNMTTVNVDNGKLTALSAGLTAEMQCR